MCKASDTTLSLFPVLPRFIPVRIKHSDKLQSLNCQTHTHTQGQKEHPDQCAINYLVYGSCPRAVFWQRCTFVCRWASEWPPADRNNTVSQWGRTSNTNVKKYQMCACVCGSRWRTIGSEGFFSNATSFILVSSAPLMCPALPLVYTSAPLFSYVCIAVCYKRKRRYINVLYQKEKQTFQPFFMHIIQLFAQKFKSQIIRTDEIIMTPVSSMTLQRKPFCQHSLFICSFNICSEVEN